MFEDFKQDKTITDLSEFLDTMELIGVPWEVQIIDNEAHIFLLDENGEGVCEFIFNEDESFNNLLKA